MARKTDGDSDKAVFQVERFVQINAQWFYTTREGDERGPFDSREDAECDLIAYIRHLDQMEEYGVKK